MLTVRRLAAAALALALLAPPIARAQQPAARPADSTAARDTVAPSPSSRTPAAPAESAGTWEVLIGHSYGSARALTQPATLTLEQEKGAPLYSVVDVGAVLRGALAPRAWLEMGLRARAGSARAPGQRAYGAMTRLFTELDPALVAIGYEYLADGHFAVTQPAATAEVTLLGGVPGLGTWVSPAVRLRWRPWLGASWGNGFRPYGRVAAEYVSGRAEAGLEATGWIVGGSAAGFLQGDVSLRLVAGLFLTASGEAGRAPPAFAPSGRVGIGLGFRLGTTR